MAPTMRLQFEYLIRWKRDIRYDKTELHGTREFRFDELLSWTKTGSDVNPAKRVSAGQYLRPYSVLLDHSLLDDRAGFQK